MNTTLRRRASFALAQLMLIFCIIAILAAIALPAFGQTTTPPVTPPVAPPSTGSVTSTPSAGVGFLNQQIGTVFGLYDTNVDYYSADANQFGVRSGLSYNTANPGIEQEVEPNVFHQFGNNMWIGDGLNLDTLGSQGTSLDAYGDHVYFKYTSHNLGGLFGLGFQKYLDAIPNKNNLEFGIGLEGYVSQHAGIFVHYNVGDDPFDKIPHGTSRVYGRLTTGVTLKF